MKLILGNCIEKMFSEIAAESIDLTVTSPPYDNLRAYNNSSTWGWYEFTAIAAGLWRVTKHGGVVVWVVNDATIKGSETGTSFRQAMFFKEIGFNLHDTMIYKMPGTGAKGSNYCYWQAFEYMFVFSKSRIKTVNRIADKINKKFGTKCTSNKQNRESVRTRMHPPNGTIVKEFGFRENIWIISNGNGHCDYTGHPAPFPEKLANDHILSWSNEGDTVFDPMMGSGTTGKMAILNNRNFVGIEIDSEYFEIAKKRIEEAQQRKQQDSGQAA